MARAAELDRSSSTLLQPEAVNQKVLRRFQREGRFRWGFKEIRWLDLLKYQAWGGFLVLIPAAVVTGYAHWHLQKEPVLRPALVYDASIR
jgi:hypothetical protein